MGNKHRQSRLTKLRMHQKIIMDIERIPPRPVRQPIPIRTGMFNREIRQRRLLPHTPGVREQRPVTLAQDHHPQYLEAVSDVGRVDFALGFVHARDLVGVVFRRQGVTDADQTMQVVRGVQAGDVTRAVGEGDGCSIHLLERLFRDSQVEA